jgi:Fe-S-cluster containining protein
LELETWNATVSDLPWYRDGLRFTCTECGDCCSGAPGYVWVTNDEIEALAAAVGIDVDAFEDQYVRPIGARKSLKEWPGGDCVFLDGQSRKCKVYNVRPRQCRTWPFWESNLKTPDDWRDTCRVCPGSGTGKLHSLEEIEEQRRTVKV